VQAIHRLILGVQTRAGPQVRTHLPAKDYRIPTRCLRPIDSDRALVNRLVNVEPFLNAQVLILFRRADPAVGSVCLVKRYAPVL